MRTTTRSPSPLPPRRTPFQTTRPQLSFRVHRQRR